MEENAVVEKTMLQFTHYETKVVREVAEPTKLQQVSRAFITAFITSEEHYEELPWYREMVAEKLAETKEANPTSNEGELQIKAFPQVRIAFVKKFLPHLAPKEKAPKARKPAALDMWNL